MGTTKAQRQEAARLLGSSRTAKKAAAGRINGQLGGRPSRYRVRARCLERLIDGAWVRLMKPYDRAAREYLGRRRRAGDDV